MKWWVFVLGFLLGFFATLFLGVGYGVGILVITAITSFFIGKKIEVVDDE